MIVIDHICLAVQNVYEGSQRLYEETGLGNYEGGWFPGLGLANRIVPLGGDAYIEVEGVVDAYAVGKYEAANWFNSCVADGDVYIGWSARVDTKAELEALARRLDSEVYDSVIRVRPDGARRPSYRTPDTITCWKAGLPNFFCLEAMEHHPARQEVSRPHASQPGGIAWMEVGGTAEEMSDWLGIRAETIGLKFNGRAPGLYAVAVRMGDREMVIRRPAALLGGAAPAP
ncbi:hypothetical protein BN1110_03755 [bacterium YEK0313]|nr:hypothetical protein BN1110_03755 [bacterium YEK0313]